jgi:hypothetical protein
MEVGVEKRIYFIGKEKTFYCERLRRPHLRRDKANTQDSSSNVLDQYNINLNPL